MSGRPEPLIDTCILIDHLKGIEVAAKELSLYETAAISAITWMEVMIGASAEDEALLRRFLSRFVLMEIDQPVREKAVELRRRYRLRLPDAIIWASAEVKQTFLVTRNSKDFPAEHLSIRIPYRL